MAQGKVLSIKDDVGAIVGKGFRIEFNQGGILVVSSLPVSIVAPQNDNNQELIKPLEIGDKLEDGIQYAGNSPDTGLPFYARKVYDAEHLDWFAAMQFASIRARAISGEKMRLPTENEFLHMFNHRSKLRIFSGSDYWTSTENDKGEAVVVSLREQNSQFPGPSPVTDSPRVYWADKKSRRANSILVCN